MISSFSFTAEAGLFYIYDSTKRAKNQPVRKNWSGQKEKFLSECKEYLRERNKTTKIIATGKGSYEFII